MTDNVDDHHGQQFLDDRVQSGRCYFSADNARAVFGHGPGGASPVIRRWLAERRILSPVRGFYVIVPAENGCPPPAMNFTAAMMKHCRYPYYVALTSAAACHGATDGVHPFTVMLHERHDPIRQDGLDIEFIKRVHLDDIPCEEVGRPDGACKVTTIEATALELVGYQHKVCGPKPVMHMLAGLHSRIDPVKLVAAARLMPISWSQRLGYMLEAVGGKDAVSELRFFVRKTANCYTPVVPGRTTGGTRHADWHLILNNISAEQS